MSQKISNMLDFRLSVAWGEKFSEIQAHMASYVLRKQAWVPFSCAAGLNGQKFYTTSFLWQVKIARVNGPQMFLTTVAEAAKKAFKQ